MRLERCVRQSRKSKTTGRLTTHDLKARSLDTLAVLVGCRESLGGQFPDGLRPDVLRYDSSKGILFVGDAKNTESPGSIETQTRLLRYLHWLYVHSYGGERKGIFAICFGDASDSKGWVDTILFLGREVGVCFTEYGVERFTQGTIVAWFLV